MEESEKSTEREGIREGEGAYFHVLWNGELCCHLTQTDAEVCAYAEEMGESGLSFAHVRICVYDACTYMPVYLYCVNCKLEHRHEVRNWWCRFTDSFDRYDADDHMPPSRSFREYHTQRSIQAIARARSGTAGNASKAPAGDIVSPIQNDLASGTGRCDEGGMPASEEGT